MTLVVSARNLKPHCHLLLVSLGVSLLDRWVALHQTKGLSSWKIVACFRYVQNTKEVVLHVNDDSRECINLHVFPKWVLAIRAGVVPSANPLSICFMLENRQHVVLRSTHPQGCCSYNHTHWPRAHVKSHRAPAVLMRERFRRWSEHAKCSKIKLLQSQEVLDAQVSVSPYHTAYSILPANVVGDWSVYIVGS